MRNKNKKAFTIIELLVAIMIIGILALIAVPLVSKYLEKGKDNYYESLGKELVVMAKSYFTDNKRELPKGQLNVNGNPIYYKVLTVSELKAKNYITNDIVDTNNNSCEESYVTIANEDGIYEYQPCLICNGEIKSGDENICLVSGIKDDTIPWCSIASYNGNAQPEEWYNKDVEVTVQGIDELGIRCFMVPKLNNFKMLPNKDNVGSFTVTKTGTYKVHVHDTYNRGTCETKEIKIDREKPVCSMEVIDETEFNKIIKITGYDTGTENVSGVAGLKIRSKELEMIKDGEKFSATYTTYRNGEHLGEVIDKAGNVGQCRIEMTGLDDTPPIITAEITKAVPTDKSGIYGVGTEVTVTCTENETSIKSFSSSLAGVEGILTNNTGMIQSKKSVFGIRGENKVITATCVDEADNSVTRTFTYNIQEYSQHSACGWNPCLTGSNTCSYGCSTGTACETCTHCETGTSCSSCRHCPYTCYNACPSNYTYCGAYGPSCCNAGLQYVGSGSYACGCYNYSCNCYNYSYGCYDYSCNCYNYSYDCSSCYYGSNTCVGGNNTCWHY